MIADESSSSSVKVDDATALLDNPVVAGFWIPRFGSGEPRVAIEWEKCPQGEGVLEWDERIWRFRYFVGLNGVKIRAIELGEDSDSSRPLAVLYHGFPEGWVVWVDIAMALDNVGYHVVIPELRGVGGSDCPVDPKEYSLNVQVDDFLAVVNAFDVGESEKRKCLLVGHDLGAVFVQYLSLREPSRLLGAVVMSVPIHPTRKHSWIHIFNNLYTDKGKFHYIIYHQSLDSQHEYETHTAEILRRMLTEGGTTRPSLAFSFPSNHGFFGPLSQGGILERLRPVHSLPPYRTEATIAFYTKMYTNCGFLGILNHYRAFHLSWIAVREEERSGRSKIIRDFPVMFLAGKNDTVIGNHPVASRLKTWLPCLAQPLIEMGLRQMFHQVCKHSQARAHFVDGVGHWVEEGGIEYANFICEFAREVKPVAGVNGR